MKKSLKQYIAESAEDSTSPISGSNPKLKMPDENPAAAKVNSPVDQTANQDPKQTEYIKTHLLRRGIRLDSVTVDATTGKVEWTGSDQMGRHREGKFISTKKMNESIDKVFFKLGPRAKMVVDQLWEKGSLPDLEWHGDVASLSAQSVQTLRNELIRNGAIDTFTQVDESHVLDFKWSSLNEIKSMKDKLDIVENYFIKKNLNESVDTDFKEDFLNLKSMSSEPVTGQKYALVMLGLINSRVIKMQTESVIFLKFLDNAYLVQTEHGQVEFPSKELRDKLLIQTLFFNSDVQFDKFRTFLSLKFNVSLPNLMIEDTILPRRTDWAFKPGDRVYSGLKSGIVKRIEGEKIFVNLDDGEMDVFMRNHTSFSKPPIKDRAKQWLLGEEDGMMCPKCNVEMKPGTAIDPKTNGSRCFPGPKSQKADEIMMINCWKCPKCGHSDDGK